MNEVVIGAPYSVTKDLMKHFKVDVVCHGQTPIALDNGCEDPYAVPKTMKKFVLIDSGKILMQGDSCMQSMLESSLLVIICNVLS